MADSSAMQNRMVGIYCWLVVALLSVAHFCHCTPSCNCQHSLCWSLLMPIVDHFSLRWSWHQLPSALCFSHCWLVVVLLSAAYFCHCATSCNRQCSCRQQLSPPIVINCRCRHRCCPHRCRQATTSAATATNIVELTVVHCQRMRQQQHHHQDTNGSTPIKIFTSPDDLDLFNLEKIVR